MYPSYPEQNDVTVSFRCSAAFKALLDDTAQTYKLSNSDVIRHGIEVMLYLINHPLICEQEDGDLREHFSPVVNFVAELRTLVSVDKSAGDSVTDDDAVIFSAIERREADMRNIKLLNRDEHGYDGCRVTLVRNKHRFVRYFSAKEYGDVDTALASALEVRDYVLEQLLISPKDMSEVFARAMKIAPPLCSCRNGRALQFKSAFAYI